MIGSASGKPSRSSAKHGEAYFEQRNAQRSSSWYRPACRGDRRWNVVDPQNAPRSTGMGIGWLDVPLERLIARAPSTAVGRSLRIAASSTAVPCQKNWYQQRSIASTPAGAHDGSVEELSRGSILRLTDIHATSRPSTSYRDEGARGYDKVLVLRMWSATAPTEYGHRRVQALNRTRSFAGTTTGGVGLARQMASTRTRAAARWTIDARHLNIAHGDGTRWPAGRGRHMEICHGAPFDEDSYIFDELERCAPSRALASCCLYGHTHQRSRSNGRRHVPRRRSNRASETEGPCASGEVPDHPVVGQPRDGTVAAYASWTRIPVSYVRPPELPGRGHAEKVLKAGCPNRWPVDCHRAGSAARLSGAGEAGRAGREVRRVGRVGR